MILSLIAILAEEISFKTYSDFRDVLILSCYSFLENLGYRQIHTFWQLGGLVDFFKGKKNWGRDVEKGYRGLVTLLLLLFRCELNHLHPLQ